MPPSLATQRPDGSSFTPHSPKKRAHVLSLGFSLANAAPGSSPSIRAVGSQKAPFSAEKTLTEEVKGHKVPDLQSRRPTLSQREVEATDSGVCVCCVVARVRAPGLSVES